MERESHQVISVTKDADVAQLEKEQQNKKPKQNNFDPRFVKKSIPNLNESGKNWDRANNFNQDAGDTLRP